MIAVRRLLFVGAVLAATSATAATALLGDQGSKSTTSQAAIPSNLGKLAERYAEAKFLEPQSGVHTYQAASGENFFALRLQPKLAVDAAPAPVDYAIVVDSTASQAGTPWQSAKLLAKLLTEKAGADDRIAISTVAGKLNSLTGGFVTVKDAKVSQSLKALDKVVPLGAADLKSAISATQASFDSSPNRQKVICYIGDGVSVLSPMRAADRHTLAANLLSKDVQFFAVPVGYNPEVLDLSGLATATGGAILRLAAGEAPESTAARFVKAMSAPVLRNVEVAYPNQVTLALPGKLPPLRSDVPTLVVGKLDGKVETLEVHCKGKLNGQSVSVTQTSSVQPSSPDCFFLPGMVRQWSQEKDAPALVRGDLALVFASTETSFAKEDLLTQASMAVQGDQFELAGKLFAEVARLDPKDAQAKAGIRLVSTLQNNPAGKAKMLNQEPGKQEDDFLKRSQQKSDVEAQRLKFAVEETLKQARKDLATNPEDALNRLKLLEQEIRSDPNIGEALRTNLRSQLEGEIRQSQIKAERFLAEAAEKEAVLSSARARESVARAREAQEERVRTSLAQFEALMARARYEESVIKADEIRAISRNLRPAYPSNVIGELAKDQSDFAYQQSQWDRIIAQKRANFLATMLTIDESSIPTPDEPPLYYPKPESFFFRGRRHRNWLELSDYRKNRWNPTYGDPNSVESVRIQSLLSKPTNKFDRRFNEPATLSDHIDFIQKVFGVTMVINTKAFQELDNSVRLEDINNAQLTIPRMPGVSLATILTYALTDLKKGEIPLNATYIIRGNYIEITTHDRAITERVARVYDVGTLVSSPAALSGIGGGGGGGFGGGGFGGGGGLGGGGLGGGGLGGGGLGGGGLGGGGLGGFGGGGFGGGGLGGFGGGGLGGGGLGGGGLGGGGLGGGGLGGGGLGGGGLGGGFGGGLGGGGGAAFSSLITRRFLATQLENLIRVIVTDADWDDPQDLAGGGGGFGGGGFGGGGFGGGAGGLGGGQGGGPGGGGLGAGGAQPIRGNPNKDQLFYYDPAFALVVKAPSNRTTRLPSPYKRRDDGAGAAAPAGPPGGPGQGLGFNDRNRGGDLAANQPAPLANQPARAADHASRLGNMMAAANTQDPRELWDHAIKNNGIDAGFAIAAVDFLTQWGKADHAAEFIKAALRHGVMPRAWMYEALAATLELSGGSPDEIEQALLSAADLKPSHADSLLQAAKAMGKHSKWQKALEFCRKSADLNPNHPQAYLHALKFAQEVQDAASMAWAAGNLISRDWPISEVNLHAQARQAAEKLAVTLSKDGREADAAKMLQGLHAHGRRDLVVKLTFQGEADLDLEATDPTGSTCNSLKRQSIGGGTLLSDLAGGQKTEIYSVAEAFPGQYKFTVRRMWGRTTGNKATLEIIQTKGSDQERIQRETIVLDRDAGLTVDLKEGRRTTTASLTAPGVFRHLVQERRQSQKNDGGLAQLENLATPIIVGGDGKVQAIQGMAGIQAKSAEMQSLALMGETEVDLPEQGGVGYSTSIHSSADGKSLRVKVDPIFIKQNIIEKTLPVIPGSGS